MNTLVWKPICTIGVRAMDTQHSILVDTLNELRMSLTGSGSREQAAEIFDRLIEFTRMHFRSEEQLLEQEHFPDLATHRAAHHRTLAEMLCKARLLQSGGMSHTSEMLDTLRASFLDHLDEFDTVYGEYLNERGIF